MKIPRLIQFFQCRRCSFNGQLKNPAAICSAHNGLYPALWTKNLIFTLCNSRNNNIVFPTIHAPKPVLNQLKQHFSENFEPKTPEPDYREMIIKRAQKSARLRQVQDANQKRRTKFAHSEHFKQRQPTTARKLWKPNAKVQEEEN